MATTKGKRWQSEINARRNIKVSRGNHEQVRHFTQGKDKAILASFKSRGCLPGEEDYHTMEDPGPNPTSLHVNLDKIPRLSDHHLPCLPSQAKQKEHTKSA